MKDRTSDVREQTSGEKQNSFKNFALTLTADERRLTTEINLVKAKAERGNSETTNRAKSNL